MIQLWISAQKKAKKNITSDTIKRYIPIRIQYRILGFWKPKNVASRTTSRNQKTMPKNVNINPKISNKPPLATYCNTDSKPITNTQREPANTTGHAFKSNTNEYLWIFIGKPKRSVFLLRNSRNVSSIVFKVKYICYNLDLKLPRWFNLLLFAFFNFLIKFERRMLKTA